MSPSPRDKQRDNRFAAAPYRSPPRLSRVKRRWDNGMRVNRQKAGWNSMLSSWRGALARQFWPKHVPVESKWRQDVTAFRSSILSSHLNTTNDASESNTPLLTAKYRFPEPADSNRNC